MFSHSERNKQSNLVCYNNILIMLGMYLYMYYALDVIDALLYLSLKSSKLGRKFHLFMYITNWRVLLWQKGLQTKLNCYCCKNSYVPRTQKFLNHKN